MRKSRRQTEKYKGLLMSDRRLPVEISTREDGSLDISCLDTLTCLGNPNGQGCLCWLMSAREARDLARWWTTEDLDVKSGQTSIRDKKVGSVLISMFAPKLIHVRGLHKFGGCKIVGYSFPREAVEYLTGWMSDVRESPVPSDRRRGGQCLKESL